MDRRLVGVVVILLVFCFPLAVQAAYLWDPDPCEAYRDSLGFCNEENKMMEEDLSAVHDALEAEKARAVDYVAIGAFGAAFIVVGGPVGVLGAVGGLLGLIF